MEYGLLGSLAIVLTAGLIGGEIASRLKIPRVTGWIMTGVILGALEPPGLAPAQVKMFRPLSDFVLGYIAFTVGSHFHLRSLINAHRRLFFLALTEALLVPAIVAAAMCLIGGLSLGHGLLLGAIALAGAPGTTMIVIREANARGVFVKTLMGAVVVVDVIAVGCFVFFESELQAGGGLTIRSIAEAAPSAALALSYAAGLGLGCALIFVAVSRPLVGSQVLGAAVLACILVAWGGAEILDVSSILSVTFLGIALSNLVADKERVAEAYLNTFGGVLFTVFYTLAGMRLRFGSVLPMLGLVALFFLGRLIAKSLSSYVAMRFSSAPRHIRWLLGPALLPHGGVAVGLILIVQTDPALAQYSETILAVGLSALAINQFVGPSITRWALNRAGEIDHDRPRLLDFIREQDIVIDLKASTRRDAIEALVEHLYKTHQVEEDKDVFLERVIARDRLESTCLGGGLMVPHEHFERGDEVVGVIGLSSQGFHWNTPDGRPVHAVVLLGVPESQRNRHLEVLAALVKFVSSQELQERFYSAATAAHAYRVLHADDATDFNYFLDDALAEPDEDPRFDEEPVERPTIRQQT